MEAGMLLSQFATTIYIMMKDVLYIKGSGWDIETIEAPSYLPSSWITPTLTRLSPR
jgi:hypothetical protein